MKKLIFITLIIFIYSLNTAAADRYWISSSSSNWNNTANWSTSSGGASGASVPGSSDVVYFDANGTGECTLDMNATVDAVNMSAGTLSTSTYTFTISGSSNSSFSGGTINGNNTFNIHPTASARVTFSGTTFNPAVDVVSPNIRLNGSTFNSTSSFEKTGSSTDGCDGGNTFVGNCTIKNTGSAYIRLGNGGDDSFSADLDVINSGSSDIFIAYNNSTTTIGGNLSITNSNSAVNVGVSYNGTSAVSITGNCTVSTNSSANSTINLARHGSLSIGGTLDITNNGSANSTIYLGRYASSSMTIDGITTISNNGADTTKRIYVGYNGDITFNGVLNLTNNSSAINSDIRCNYNDNSNNTYNDNIVVEVTDADCDGIRFGSSNGTGTLATLKTITIGASGYSAGYLYFRNFTQTGSTAQSITLTGTGFLYNYDSNWGGNIDFKAPRVYTRGTTYKGNCKFEKTGATNDNSVGGNTFEGNVELINTGSSTIRFGNGDTDDFQGDLDITNNGSSNIQIAYHSPGTTTISGDLTIDNIASSASGTITLSRDSISTMVVNGNTTVTNSGAGSNKRVYLGYNGDITFNGTLSISNSSSATTSYIDCNYDDNSLNKYNGNIVIDVTHADCDGIRFGNSGGASELADTKTITIGGSGFSVGTLYMGNFTQIGSTAQSLTLTGTANIDIRNSEWNANLSVTSPSIAMRSTTYNGSSTFEKTGDDNSSSQGGNTFNGDFTFTNSGDGYMRFGDGNSDTYAADATFNNSGSNSVFIARQGAGHSISGNLTINNTGSGSQTYIADNANSSLSVGGNITVTNSSSGSNGRVYIGNHGDVTITGDLDISNSSTATNSYVYIGNDASESEIVINGDLLVENTNAASDGININAKSVSIANGKTIKLKAGGFNNGRFSIRNLTQAGTAAISLDFGSSAYLYLQNNNFGGNVSFKARRFYSRGTTYNGTAYIEKTGTSDDNNYGGNTFKENVEIVNSSGYRLSFSETDPDVFEKNLKINNSGTDEIYLGNNASGVQVQGDLTITNQNNASCVYVANNSSSSITIGGTTSLVNSSGATNSRIFFGNEGDVTTNGDVSVNNNSSGDNSYITIGQGSNSTISITGDVTISNQGGNTERRVYFGNNGDVTINGDLSITNTATATNSHVYCHHGANSVNQYNGNITVSASGADCDGIYFGYGGGSGTMTASHTISIGGGGYSDGSLYIRNFTQTGSTAQSLSISSSRYLTLRETHWGGNVTFTAPALYLYGSVFDGTATLEKSGSNSMANYGGNTFNANTTIKNSGSGYYHLCNNQSNDYNANVTFIKTSTGDFTPAYNYRSTIAGNLNFDFNGTCSIGNSTDGGLEFDGSGAQSINNVGAANILRFRTLMTNNTTDEITLNTPVRVRNNLNLTNGNIITTSTNILRMNDDAVVNAVSDDAYIDGPIIKYGDDAFVFPVGGTDIHSDSHYAGIGISAPSSTSDSFTAEYHASRHSSATTVSAPLQKVSLLEYWDLDRTNGTSTVDVTLYWGDGDRSVIGNLTDLRVAHWDGSTWEDKGNNSTTGTAASGSITANGISSFSPFSFGTVDSSTNVLPVSLIDFNITKEGDFARINWTTATEVNNDYFIVERTSNFNEIKEIERISGAGNSNLIINYSTLDKHPKNGISYYRIVQFDYDGSRTDYKWKSISFNNTKIPDISIFPNPVENNIINLNFINIEGSVEVEIVDISGRSIYKKRMNLINSNSIKSMNIDLNSGIYFVRINDGAKAFVRKFVVR